MAKHITMRTTILYLLVSIPVLFIVNVAMAALGVMHTNGTIDIRSGLTLLADSFFLTFFSVASCSVVVLITVSRLRKRIVSYTQSLKTMVDDKINEKLEVEGEDELSSLATAFNELSERFTVIEKQRTEFVSNASHELKTPLSSIKLMADSIIQTPDIDMDYVREFLTDMNEEVERLNRIVNKLLYITKLDTLTETMSGSLELINLKDVVSGTHKNLLPIAEIEGKELVLNANEDILIMANKDILWQAVYNIVNQAIKESNI